MRSVAKAVVLVLGCVLAARAAAAMTPGYEVASRAAEMIREKIGDAEPGIELRLRALYRVSRASGNPLAPSPVTRRILASNLRWLVARELAVAAALADELEAVETERADIAATRVAIAATPPSLIRPVKSARVLYGFGERSAGALRLSSRGVAFAANPGEPVAAPIDGVVVFSGRIIDQMTVIIERDRFWVVVGPLAGAPPVGERVVAGASIGEAVGPISVELRQTDERGGFPVDPGPLLNPR